MTEVVLVIAGIAILLAWNNAPKTDSATWKDRVGALAFLIALPIAVIGIFLAIDGQLPGWVYLVGWAAGIVSAGYDAWKKTS